MPINDKNITPAISGIVSGQRAIKVGDKVYPVGIGGNFLPNVNQIDVDLSFVTAAEGDILAGKVGADKNGNPVNGTLTLPPDAEAVSVSGNVVTIPSGNRAESQTVTVGTAKDAEIITPGTSDQTVAADTYLAGNLTIKGDANLTASNIKSGVTIFDITGTFEGSGGGGTGSGTFDLAKVTEFSPYVEAMSGLSQIVVSGLGDDYDSANGTYIVTAETEKESDIFKRIYKHTSGEWFIWGEYEPEYEEGYWYIGPAADSGLFVCYVAEELTDNTYNFENWDTGDSYDLTLDVTKTDYPETPMVLKGVRAKRYDGELSAWIVGTEEFSLGAYNIPKIGRLYVLADNCTVGNEIASDATDAIPGGFTSNTSISGYIINQSHGDGNYPQAYVVFNQNYTESDYAWWSGNIGVSASNPAWFSIQVPEAFVPSGIWIMNEIQTPENFKTAVFQGSNDGSTWEDIYTIDNSPNTGGYRQEHLFDCNKAYNHFRMFFTASHSGGVSIQAFKIYKLSFIEEE